MLDNLNVLAIDDDLSYLRSLKTALSGQYNVLTANGLASAQDVLNTSPVFAILLDLDLGTETGTSLLRVLNENPSRAPVIVISGHVNIANAVELLNLQIFGFLEKPARLADILSILEKCRKQRIQSEVLREPQFTLHISKRLVEYNDEQLTLTQTQTDIVCLFLNKKGLPIQREELIKSIWGDRHVSRNALDTHLLNIKNKLPPFRDGLKLIHGMGYCYEG